MKYPELLKQGDTIGILAPARKINRAEIEFATRLFNSWGLQVQLSKNIYSDHHAYLSGSDQERLDDFQTMLDDTTVKAIISARGGYGSTRIVDRVNYTSLTKQPKWLIGFSDITAFHLKFLQYGVASIHGTMPILFSKRDSAESLESLHALLFAGTCSMEAPPSESNRIGSAKAEVIGGNLSLIADALGSSSEPDTNGKILILEEVDEYLYRVDRMMTQLKRTGKLKNLAGLVIGHMTEIKEGDFSFGENVQQIIQNATAEFKFPIGFRFPTGHENPNRAWVSGGVATLEVTAEGSRLTFDKIISNIV